MSWTPLQVRALRLEADDVLGVELAPPGPAPLPFDWAPGAHVDLRLGNGAVRQYSVVSLPEDGHVYLGIKREKASRGGSQWLHEHLRLGARVEVGLPRNLFSLQPGTGQVVLVAAGIGITPLLAMYRQCQAQGRSVRLLFFTRDAEQVPFIQYLDANTEVHAGLRAPMIDHRVPGGTLAGLGRQRKPLLLWPCRFHGVCRTRRACKRLANHGASPRTFPGLRAHLARRASLHAGATAQSSSGRGATGRKFGTGGIAGGRGATRVMWNGYLRRLCQPGHRGGA